MLTAHEGVLLFTEFLCLIKNNKTLLSVEWIIFIIKYTKRNLLEYLT